MPRSGVNGTYTLPPNTDNQQPLTPISSSMFNSAMDDVEQTFNTPTPIAYGGTGASDDVGARTNLGAASLADNTFTGSQTWAEGASIASAATLVLGTDGNMFHVTGTTTIGAISGSASPVTLVFDAATPIVHNATTLILPGAQTLITTPGDVAVFVSEGGGNWRCVSYRRSGDTTVALDGAAKFWVSVKVTAGVPSIAASYNVTSITDTGFGLLTITLDRDFSSANWACSASLSSGADSVFPDIGAKTAGTVLVRSISVADVFADPAGYEVMGFGSQ